MKDQTMLGHPDIDDDICLSPPLCVEGKRSRGIECVHESPTVEILDTIHLEALKTTTQGAGIK